MGRRKVYNNATHVPVSKQKKKITREEVEKAVEEYPERGGEVTQLVSCRTYEDFMSIPTANLADWWLRE